MRDDQQDDGRDHDNCESASVEILSGAGNQVLQKFDTNPDDQLHRHQANADAEYGAVVVDGHVGCPAAPAKAQEDKPGVDDYPSCTQQKNHVNCNQGANDQNNDSDYARNNDGFNGQKIYMFQRVLKNLHP